MTQTSVVVDSNPPIDPMNATDYDRSDAELQRFWIFSVLVAGKNADVTAKIVQRLLSNAEPGETPFEYLRRNQNSLHNTLVANRTGQYHRISKAIEESLDLDLRSATLEQLEAVHGVGMKTARFFVLHTRRDARCAVLDTHVLKWLKSLDVREVPDGAPRSRKQYLELERLFIHMAKAYFRDMSLADVDLFLWSIVSGRLEGDLPFFESLFSDDSESSLAPPTSPREVEDGNNRTD